MMYRKSQKKVFKSLPSKKTVNILILAKNDKKEGDKEEEENDDDDDEEGDDEDSSSCDGRLSTFVRTFDGASFLPDDYEHLSEVFSKHGPYRHHKRLEDMLETLNRLWKMAEKVQDNKDLKDTGLYVSSVLSDKLYEAEVSAQCTADLIAIGGGLQALQPWAFKCKKEKNFFCFSW